MSPGERFQYHPSEPLSPWQRSDTPPAAEPDLRAFRLEFTSRGDRVPGRLLLPPPDGDPFPLIVLQHGEESALGGPASDAAAGVWVRAGAGVASIELPLCGSRASSKVRSSPFEGPLADDFIRQSVVQLRRLLDLGEGLSEIASERTAYVGIGVGARLGALLCDADPRPSAAVLIGDGSGGEFVEPTRQLWLDDTGDGLTAATLKPTWEFLAPHLRLA